MVHSSLTIGRRCVVALRDNVKQSTLDSPKPGDTCILLVPAYSDAATIRLVLGKLQQRFGGEIAAPIHLSCQRFRATHQELLQLKPKLVQLISQTPPIPIRGEALEPVYSTFRAVERLRLRIQPDSTLTTFFHELNSVLEAMMLTPLQPTLPEGIVLLEDIKMSILKVERYPHKLFTCQRLMLSQLKAPGRYQALFSIPFSQVPMSHDASQLRW